MLKKDKITDNNESELKNLREQFEKKLEDEKIMVKDTFTEKNCECWYAGIDQHIKRY